jgi:hypothetical protein
MNRFPQSLSVSRPICVVAALSVAALGTQFEDKADIHPGKQQERIDNGMPSGELTRRERKCLE